MTTPSPNTATAANAWTTASNIARAGHTVDLHGTVAHTTAAPAVSLLCALGAFATVLGLVWPVASGALLAALVLSALMELNGGVGWVRTLITKDVTHSVIVWPSKDGERPPDRPTLVITAPIEPHITLNARPAAMLVAPIAACLGGAMSVAVAPHWGFTSAIAVSGMLITGAALIWGLDRYRPSESAVNPGRSIIETMLIRGPESSDFRVVWALVGGGATHQDGLKTLLLNHEHRLDRAHTRLLHLQPGTGPLSIIATEGRVRTQHPDPVLCSFLNGMKLPQISGSSGALCALKLGWRAAAINVAADQTHRAQEAIENAISHAKACAQDGQW